MTQKQRSPDTGSEAKRPASARLNDNQAKAADHERKKMRFMKWMVITCIVTLIAMFVAAYIGYWHGIDMDTWLMLGCGAFSIELASTTVLKIYKKDDETTKTAKKTTTKRVNG